MTEIKVGEKWEHPGSACPRTVRDVGEKFVVFGYGDAPVSFAEPIDKFVEENRPVEPDIQVGDVLRRTLVDGDELYVVSGVGAGGIWVEPSLGGPTSAALPLAPWWKRTDYKVPVLRSNQAVSVADGWLLSGSWAGRESELCRLRNGRVVCWIDDNGKTVELPCPTSKES